MYQLLCSYLNTTFCSWAIAFLMPLLLLEVTNSPIYVSAAYAVGILPYVVVTPIADILGDRMNKKRMIQIGELVSTIFVTVLTFVPFKAAHAPFLLGLHFTLSSPIALHHPAFQAMIPSVVKETISHFNAADSTATQGVVALGVATERIVPAMKDAPGLENINATTSILRVLSPPLYSG